MSETVLVTGASSGIGLELAKRFANDGARVVLSARSEDKLQELAEEFRQAGGQADVFPCDLSEPDAARQLCERLSDARIEIDVLVNNAGFGALGKVADLSVDRQQSMIRLNIEALTMLTRHLLPGMLERGQGGVLNVASTAAFVPGPNMAVYYASKAYVLSFSEALRHELKETPISVSCLCPGATKTGFGADSGMGETEIFEKAMAVEKVADAAYQGYRQNKAIVIPGKMNWLISQSPRLLPRWLVRRMVASLQQPDEK